MITAELLKTLTTFTAPALTRAINLAGYTKDSFASAKFVGITNAGEFAYHATFPVVGGTETCKVFVKYDPTEGRVTADY